MIMISRMILVGKNLLNDKEPVIIELKDSIGDHFIRPFDAKPVGIESWSIALPLNDIARELIRDQIIQRRERFVKALQNNAVETLPRLTVEAQIIKCKNCSYRKICFDEDMETLDAIRWDVEQQRTDPLKMSGIVKLMDGNE